MIKQGLVWLVVAFAVYSLLATPDVAADAVRGAGEGIRGAGDAIITFFDALTP